MTRWALLLFAACGRLEFGVKADAAADVAADATLGPWGSPSLIDLGLMPLDDPSMTGDGLEIYVNCGTAICGADRASTADPWPAVTTITSLPGQIFSPHLSFDGLTVWVVTASPSTIRVATRTTRTDSWSSPQAIPEIASSAGDDGPAVTSDALDMVFDSLRGGSLAIYATSRPTTSSTWATPVALGEINAIGSVARPHLTDDRLSIYFQGPGTGTGGDIWVARRATPTAAFDPPQRLDVVNTTVDEEDPWVSSDQHVLLLSSARGGVNQIWQATR